MHDPAPGRGPPGAPGFDSVRASSAAGSGTSDVVAVRCRPHGGVVGGYLDYDFSPPRDAKKRSPDLLQGPCIASSLLDLQGGGRRLGRRSCSAYRRLGSRLEGHPTPVLPWVDVASGSLGQGLPTGVGVALAGKRLDRLPYRVWVLCGDSEMAEGSMWEAFEHAAHEGLDNLTAIVDVNRLGQRGETMHGWDLERFVEPAEASGGARSRLMATTSTRSTEPTRRRSRPAIARR